MHPLHILLNNGVHVALSSDDPSVFGNMGLTFIFVQVYKFTSTYQELCAYIESQVLVSSEVTGLSTLGQLAQLEDSLEVDCFPTCLVVMPTYRTIFYHERRGK